MVEKTNVGMVVFISDITSMGGFRSDEVAALLSACSLACCGSHQLVFPCREVLFYFRVLLHFVLSAARPSQDIVSMSTAFISLTRTSLNRR